MLMLTAGACQLRCRLTPRAERWWGSVENVGFGNGHADCSTFTFFANHEKNAEEENHGGEIMINNLPKDVSGGKGPGCANESELDGHRLIDRLTALIGAYSIPGMDIRAMLERSRKDVEALAAANKQVLQGVYLAMAGEGELLSRSVEQTIQVIRNVSAAESLTDIREKQVALLIEALETTLATMQEVAGSIAAANTEAFATLQKRLSEKVSDIQTSRNFAEHSPEKKSG